jgi:signal transduction histidine kinase
MRERALNLGGRLTVESPPQGGTLVRLVFRHRGASDQELPPPALAGAATAVAAAPVESVG